MSRRGFKRARGLTVPRLLFGGIELYCMSQDYDAGARGSATTRSAAEAQWRASQRRLRGFRPCQAIGCCQSRSLESCTCSQRANKHIPDPTSSGPRARRRRSQACEVGIGSIASFRNRSPDICLSPNSGARADISGPPLRARARSRCDRDRGTLLQLISRSHNQL